VLRVISSSPSDAQPVFDTIAKSVARLCKAQFCHVFRSSQQSCRPLLRPSADRYSIRMSRPSRRPRSASPSRRSRRKVLSASMKGDSTPITDGFVDSCAFVDVDVIPTLRKATAPATREQMRLSDRRLGSRLCARSSSKGRLIQTSYQIDGGGAPCEAIPIPGIAKPGATSRFQCASECRRWVIRYRCILHQCYPMSEMV